MDYTLSQSLSYNTQGIKRAIIMYDIMCQWYPRFPQRIESVSEALGVAPDFLQTLTLKRGIGLFHVHGHVKQCFARYAPTFIRGAGMLAGEVIETLWSPLNHTASSARTMTWDHRQEYLDSHMGDSNWKKLVQMCKLYHDS